MKWKLLHNPSLMEIDYTSEMRLRARERERMKENKYKWYLDNFHDYIIKTTFASIPNVSLLV